MKKYILYSLLLMLPTLAMAQQQPTYTQYMFNTLAINPAYAGSQGCWNATMLGRWQWLGLRGAPQTQTMAVHGPILNERIALGLNVVRDEIGVTSQNAVFASYAYRIKLTSSATLSLGLQGGINQYQTDYTNVQLPNGNDQLFISQAGQRLLPNVGAGFYLQTRKWYVGASVPHIMTGAYAGNQESQALQARHYFAHAGYVFTINDALKLKPNFLVKMVEGAPTEVDVNANLLILERLWIGASYRSFDALSGLVEVLATERLRVGYAYDYTLTDLQQVGVNTHEMMLNYRFAIPKEKIVTPRYF